MPVPVSPGRGLSPGVFRRVGIRRMSFPRSMGRSAGWLIGPTRLGSNQLAGLSADSNPKPQSLTLFGFPRCGRLGGGERRRRELRQKSAAGNPRGHDGIAHDGTPIDAGRRRELGMPVPVFVSQYSRHDRFAGSRQPPPRRGRGVSETVWSESHRWAESGGPLNDSEVGPALRAGLGCWAKRTLKLRPLAEKRSQLSKRTWPRSTRP
jgi:hypothetical protein